MRDLIPSRPRAGTHAALVVLALCEAALAGQGGSVMTTVYVGRYFEIRHHDQPIKYVFNGATRVAEITGSLSANLRVHRLRLYSGWNLCSLAVTGPFPAGGADVISAAYQWNPASGDYSSISLGQTLTVGTVLWIKARTNAVVSVLGAYADPVPNQLQTGGAYVPATGLEAWSPALPDSASSWDFDAATPQWFDHLAGDLAAVSGPSLTLGPGQAFYAEAAAPAELQVPAPALRIRYYHQDHLGSSSAITDANGELVEETAYYPFGAPRNELSPRQMEDPYEFTQKERDRETTLHYFEARYLAGGLARFLTVDHKCGDLDALTAARSFPQHFNVYACTINNPLRYIDPDGKDISTPLIGYGGESQKNGSVIVTLSPGTHVTVKPDTIVSREVYSYFDKGFSHAATMVDIQARWDQKKGTVSVSVSLQTSYQEYAVWADQGDGFGSHGAFRPFVPTVGLDILGLGSRPTVMHVANSDPYVKAREGQRGSELLYYMEKNPLPQFKPAHSGDINEFYKYQTQLEEYQQKMYAAAEARIKASDSRQSQ